MPENNAKSTHHSSGCGTFLARWDVFKGKSDAIFSKGRTGEGALEGGIVPAAKMPNPLRVHGSLAGGAGVDGGHARHARSADLCA